MSAPIIDCSLKVSRPTGGALELNDHDNFELARPLIRPGVTYARRAVTGDNQPGEILIGAVRAVATLAFRIRIKAGTWSAAGTLADTLFSALGQFSYTITETTEGVTTIYSRCQPADVVPREVADPSFAETNTGPRVVLGWAEYDVTIRCHPRTVETP
jgi:hypothetical protein